MRIIGTGSSLPSKIVTNQDISSFLDTSDEWIVPRTGIRSRHVISDERLEDLGASAALRALEDAGLEACDIDLFICSCVVSEHVTPGMSSLISSITGLRCPCIDINCACPGFVYAMDIAESYFLAGKVNNVLIVCAEEPTRMASWEDRCTCVLFGDGAGAAVFTTGDNVKAIKLYSDPDPGIICQKHSLIKTPYYTGQDEDTPLSLNGREVFRFAINTSLKGISDVLNESGKTKDEVDWFLVHQANLRIVDGIRNRLELPEEKFPVNIADHGNSSSASCPILLDECRRNNLFRRGDLLLFSAFGAGLLSAAALIEW